MTDKQSKYNVSSDVSKRTYNDIVFDSAVEMKYYRDFIIPNVMEGNIVSYEMQVKFELQPKFEYNGEKIRPIDYVADFVYTDKNNTTFVIDIKGMPTPEAKLKRKLLLYKYPDINYHWISYSKLDGGFVDLEKIQKGRKLRKAEKTKGNK